MSNDFMRRLFVTVSQVLCVLGALIGSGVLGDPVEEQAGGSLSADATLLAPAGPAFSIWSVIYLGLLAYAIWQWFPSQAHQPRHRAIGWLAGMSMLLNALWLLVTQQGWIWISVLVIFLLVLALGLIIQRLHVLGATGGADSIVTDITFGLYLGWVTLAACANVAAAGSASGWDLGAAGNRWLAVAVIAVAAGINLFLAYGYGTRISIAAAAAWGLAWIAIGRLTDQPHDATVGIAAAAGALILFAGTVILRIRRPSPHSAGESPARV